MDKLIAVIKKSLIGGFIVIFPIIVLATVYEWLYGLIINMLQPFSSWLPGQQTILTNILVVLVILAICILIGILIKTKIGQFYHDFIEKKLLSYVPGYFFIKKILVHFLHRKKSAFLGVALVNIFENDTLVTAFITDECGEYTTVFCAQALNPTTGVIYHVKNKYVHKVDISVDVTMRTLIGCGSGSDEILSHFIGNKDICL